MAAVEQAYTRDKVIRAFLRYVQGQDNSWRSERNLFVFLKQLDAKNVLEFGIAYDLSVYKHETLYGE